MFAEDNNGFTRFPFGRNVLQKKGETFIYLISFEIKNKNSKLSNINLHMPGIFISDDMSIRPDVENETSIDKLIENQKKNDNYDKFYFPNIENDLKKIKSINLVSCICIGWSNKIYEIKGEKYWNATFRDLTNEGSKLYYSIKKLHNNKETRILTFNNIS